MADETWGRCAGYCGAEHHVHDLIGWKDGNGEIIRVCQDYFDKICGAITQAAKEKALRNKEESEGWENIT